MRQELYQREIKNDILDPSVAAHQLHFHKVQRAHQADATEKASSSTCCYCHLVHVLFNAIIGKGWLALHEGLK